VLGVMATIAVVAPAIYLSFDQLATLLLGADGRPLVSVPVGNGALPPAAPQLLFEDVSRDEAQRLNAATPVSADPIEMASPLILPLEDGNTGRRRAETDCLTAAVYYEAGAEPLLGQRAVAQVVLNRVRHPAFPNTICGVVFEGSQRSSGCQFTFTCDGSLSRRPSRDGWERARQVALIALSGSVEPSVGMATHYHADYVRPYWAPSLSKIGNIGTHIFYRWSGAWGLRRAFTQVLATSSPVIDHLGTGWSEAQGIQSGPFLPTMTIPLGDDTMTSSRSGPVLTVPTAQLPHLSEPIAADQGSGTLLADENAGTLREN
jgi:spore germination cell wall hydrolase CwlJ-like protein